MTSFFNFYNVYSKHNLKSKVYIVLSSTWTVAVYYKEIFYKMNMFKNFELVFNRN